MINRLCGVKLETSTRRRVGELCFGTNQLEAKIEKISISRAIRLQFLRFLVSAIRCEVNKINRWREERPIGSRTVKMLRDLRLHALLEQLKQAGEGARGVFKGGACACQLKFQTQGILSDRSGRICKRWLEEEALRNDDWRAQDCNSQDRS